MSLERPANPVSAAKLALAVKRLRAETPGLHLLAAEPVAIVGMGCRFPAGADSPDVFWRMLEQGVDAVREMPEERWPTTGMVVGKVRRGAYFDHVDTFDAEFFNIPPREANSIDPQQRMLLEVTWDALRDAGVRPESLAGTQAGVFVAISNTDYTRLQLREVSQSNSQTGVGSAACLAAGYLSFLLDTRGPALVVDTACSSSLTATHLACQSLRNRECHIAIVGAASLKILPDEVVVFSQWGMLSPDAHCKTFDEQANGFVPGEGCGVVVLKRLADALAAGDRIRAVIRGSALNHDGRTSVMTAPNGLAQEAVLRSALESASIEAKDVAFIETHGTGTSLGDPIEVEAIRSVYGSREGVVEPCLLGAVKTNLGHLESAAGMAGLIKAVLSLEHEKIPGNLHFHRLNSRISLEHSRLELAQHATLWPRHGKPRFAAVSSFGLSGTNAHFVIEEAPAIPARPAPKLVEECLLLISARSASALRQLAQDYLDLLAAESSSLHNICANAAVYCQHYEHRLAARGESREVVRLRLLDFIEGRAEAHTAQGVSRRRQQGAALIFTGQGSAWEGMGRELFAEYPKALQSVERIDAQFSKLAGWSLVEVLTGNDQSRSLADTDTAQPLIFAVQVAITELLASWGIVPDAVVGHSIGELAAAYVGGYLTLEQSVRILYLRSRSMARAGKGGRMLAVALVPAKAEALLADYSDRVVIAAYNSPDALTLSGDPEALTAIQATLEGRDVFARWVPVEYAFHSPAMRDASLEFASSLGSVAYLAGTIPFISTVTGKRGTPSDAPNYWADGITEPVRFQAAVESLIESGFGTFIEVGPGTALSRFVTECGSARQSASVTLPTMRKSVSTRRSMNMLLAELYAHGRQIHWEKVFGAHPNHVALPSYPWQRKRFWLDPSVVSRHIPPGQISKQYIHPLLGNRIQSPFTESDLFESHLSVSRLPYLEDHRLGQVPLVPFSAWIELAGAAHSALSPAKTGVPTAIVDFSLTHPLLLTDEETRVQVAVDDNSFRVSSLSGNTWTAHASCRYEAIEGLLDNIDLSSLRERCSRVVSREEIYQTLGALGLEYGPAFRPLQEVWATDREALALLRLPDSLHAEAHAYNLHPVLLDGCLQILSAAIGERAKDLFLPMALDRYEGFASALEVWVHARVLEISDEQLTANFVVADSTGRVLAAINGLRARKSVARSKGASLSYELSWLPKSHTVTRAIVKGQKWLVLRGTPSTKLGLTHAIEAVGCTVTMVEDRDQLRRALLDNEIAGLVIDARDVAPMPVFNLDGVEYHPEKWSVLALLDALAVTGRRELFKIRIVTSRAMAVSSGDLAAPSQAALWGIARTSQIEHPECEVVIADVDEVPLDSAARVALMQELLTTNSTSLSSPPPDLCVAYRDDQRFVSRLDRSSAEPTPAMSAELRALVESGTILITGGLGSLGLMTAKWLADHGARNLVLVSRNTDTSRDMIGKSEKSLAISAMRSAGINVLVTAADVSDEQNVRQLLEKVRETMPPFCAVFHEAGISEDSMLAHLDWEKYCRVTSPKVAGAWNLHKLTERDPIQLMVLFSSAASLLGSAGQASYAAGNGFLDALAHLRTSLGKRTLSVNWGAWADSGMAAKLSRLHADRLELQGLHAMHPQTAFPALLSAIGSHKPQVAIMDVDWAQFEKSARPAHLVLCRDLLPNTRHEAQRGMHRGALLEVLREAPAEDHHLILSRYVKQCIRQVFALEESFAIDDDRPLQELGLDSLMAVEIKNMLQSAIEQELRSTLIFDHPTVESLVEYLDTLLWAARQQEGTRAVSVHEEEIRI